MSSADRGDKRGQWISTAIAIAALFAGVYGGRLLSLPWWQQLLIIPAAGVLLALLAKVLIDGISTNFRKQLFDAVKWVGRGIPGVVLALITFFLATNARALPAALDRSCGEPIDLRVVTGPENVASLTDAARRYAERGDCRTATVSVNANSSIDELSHGFATGWTSPGSEPDDCQHLPTRMTLLGPRPDIWIPDSRMVAQKIQEDLGSPDVCSDNPLTVKADLDIQESVASSPVVMGVFTSANRINDVGDEPKKPSLASLLQTMKTNQVLDSVVRPSPDASQSGLLSTPLLYRALRQAGWVSGANIEAEKLLDKTAISTGDTVSLLCGFREDDARGIDDPPESTAVILPESFLVRYDHGDELGGESTCRRGRKATDRWWLHPFYTADLPVLDYPFVRVRWQGEDDATRNRAVEDFRKWLENDELAREGFRTASGTLTAGDNPRLPDLRNGGNAVPQVTLPHKLQGDTGCVGTWDQVSNCYDDARPNNPVSVLLDISGSMAKPVGTTGTRLSRAQQLAQRVVAGVRPETTIKLFAFYDNGGRPVIEQRGSSNNAAARADVQVKIQQAGTTGSDLSLITAIDQAAGRLQRGVQTLVVLTDGQPGRRPGREYADQARELSGRLKDQKPGLRVLVVPTGPASCDAPTMAPIIDALGGDGACAGTPKEAVDDISRDAIREIFWGSD